MRARLRETSSPSWLLSVCVLSTVVAGVGSPTPCLAEAPCPLARTTAELVAEGDALSKSDVHAAIAKYEQARASAPRSVRVLEKLAAAHEKREAWESALQTWGEACVLSPGHAGFAYGTARAMIKLERWPQALDALRATLSMDDRHAEAHAAFASVVMHLYERPTRDHEAATHLRRAIDLSPDNASYYASLGDHLARLGFASDAELTLKAGLERARDDGARLTLRVLLARVAQGAGDDVAALAHLEAGQALCADCVSPERRILPFLLGSAYARARPPRKAEASAQLSTFMKRVCKGAAAMRYRDPCTTASGLLETLGTTP